MGTLSVTDVRPDLPATSSDGSANPEYDAPRRPHLESVGETTVVIEAGNPADHDVVPLRRRVQLGQHRPRSHRRRGGARERAELSGRRRHRAHRRDARRLPEGRRRALRTRRHGRAAMSTTSSVSLWGDQPGVSVDGRRAQRRSCPSSTRVIPFAVTGEGPDGRRDDVRVPPRPRRRRPRAGAALGCTDARGRRARVGHVRHGDARGSAPRRDARGRIPRCAPSGARSEASCTVESGTLVRYDAGAGAPWADACQVPVRLVGQDRLDLPFGADRDPRARSRSPSCVPDRSPSGRARRPTFDLQNMTTLAAARGLEQHRATRSSTPARRSRSRSTDRS